MWSTLVGGEAIKPGVDTATGQHLIALKQSGASQRDRQFVVEIMSLTELPAAARHGANEARRAIGGMLARL